MHTESLRGYHNTSLFPGPQSYLMFASWEPKGGDEFPLLPVGIGSDWGLAPGPYLILWPFLVSWSIPPMSPVRAQPSRVRMPVWKRTWNTGRLHASSFILGFLCSDPVEPAQGAAWLESLWGLQKCCRNQYSKNQAPHLESWRTQFIMLVGPEELTLQALNHKQRVTEFLYTDRHD